VIATLLLDGVIACNEESDPAVWAELPGVGFLFGQSMVLGAWLAVGQLHRLARGALFVGGLASIAFIFDTWRGRVPSAGLSEEAVTLFSFLAATAFCVTWILHTLLPLPFATRNASRTLQFPLIEIFGWTIVVALASIALRAADFVPMISDPASVAEFAGAGIVTAIFVQLFLPPAEWSMRNCLIAIAVELSYLSILLTLFVALHRWEYQAVIFHCGALPLTSHLTVLTWMLVRRMDHDKDQPLRRNAEHSTSMPCLILNGPSSIE